MLKQESQLLDGARSNPEDVVLTTGGIPWIERVLVEERVFDFSGGSVADTVLEASFVVFSGGLVVLQVGYL
jgi:hypothetical protein